MRAFLLLAIGIVFGIAGMYTFQHFFSVPAFAQNIEEYVPNVLRQKITPKESSEDFLTQEIHKYKMSGEKFILANLSSMQLDVYEKGSVVFSVPIQAKGREGSWWETPAGVYSIKTKEKNHLSSIGNVYMPWSMQFQGNFFIHGLPYYPDGTLVSTSYSGGCIRLDTNDAKEVFGMVDRGTPLVVYESVEENNETNRNYTFGPGSLTTNNFLVADLQNGFTFASQNTNSQVDAGVAAHLLTAIISAEYMDIERNITADSSDQVPTKIERLQAGKKYAVYDYLYLLLQESSEEAAHILARALGSSRTLSLISQKALAIGMQDSEFKEINSVSLINKTTTPDLYQLMRYMYYNRKFLLSISANTAETRIYGKPAFSDIQNQNIFLGDPQFVGGAVRNTEQGYTGLFVFEIPFGEVVRPVGVIVVDSKDIQTDVTALRTFVQTSFRK